MSNFRLNPCAACMKKYDITDINNINQCCYDTFAAFSGASSINEIRNNPDAKNCIECVKQSKIAMGRDLCEFRLPAYPVWSQDPHYFPDLLTQTKDPEESKKQCLKLCDENYYPKQCKENCITDYDTVEQFTTSPPTVKVRNLAFYISFFLFFGLLIPILLVFVRTFL
jgi:hypothetical protein